MRRMECHGCLARAEPLKTNGNKTLNATRKGAFGQACQLIEAGYCGMNE